MIIDRICSTCGSTNVLVVGHRYETGEVMGYTVRCYSCWAVRTVIPDNREQRRQRKERHTNR